MKLTIITLLRNQTWGGSENLWYRMAIYALSQNVEILVITYEMLHNSDQIQKLRDLGAEIVIIRDKLSKTYEKIINKFYHSYQLYALTKPVIKKIKSFSPNKILINQPGNYDLIFNKVAYTVLVESDCHYDFIIHSYVKHINLSDEMRTKMIELIKNANKLYLVAEAQKKNLEDQLDISLNNIEYVQNPLNVQNSYINYPYTDQSAKMAMVTTLDIETKGVDKIIRILSREKWESRSFKLEIYGEGKDENILKDLISAHMLEDKIKLMGFSNDIESIWRKNQILIMVSNVDAAPSVLLEAMVCGRACVCTDIGFNNQWIKNNHNGFISQSFCEDMIDDTLETAWKERGNWKQLGINCRLLTIDKIIMHPEIFFLHSILNN